MNLEDKIQNRDALGQNSESPPDIEERVPSPWTKAFQWLSLAHKAVKDNEAEPFKSTPFCSVSVADEFKELLNRKGDSS